MSLGVQGYFSYINNYVEITSISWKTNIWNWWLLILWGNSILEYNNKSFFLARLTFRNRVVSGSEMHEYPIHIWTYRGAQISFYLTARCPNITYIFWIRLQFYPARSLHSLATRCLNIVTFVLYIEETEYIIFELM